MKRSIKNMMVLLVIGAAVISCKKGDNDPALSLKSRKARLAGDWVISSYTSTKTVNSNVTQTIRYDGNVETNTTYIAGTPFTTTRTYTESYSFDKNGSYTYQYIETGNNPDTYSSEGNWAFLGKNKSADLKNKEAVMLTTTKSTSPGYVETTTGTFNVDDLWIMDQLKSNEIIVKRDETTTDGGSTTTKTSTTVLTKK